MSRLRQSLLGVCLAAALLGQSPSAEPRKISILTVQVGIQAMGDPLLVQQRGDKTWVPLAELSRQLYLAITVDPVAGTAEGFVIEEKNTFRLDLKQHTVKAEGRTFTFDADTVFFEGEECYVELRSLAAWLPLLTKLNADSATLEVRPMRLLPVQARWKREKDSNLSSGHGPVRIAYDPQAHPYAPIAAPFVDQSLSWAAAEKNGSTHATGSATTFMSADLLWSQASAYMSTDFTGQGTLLRGSLARRDPDGKLLGPLGAREVVAGRLDVQGVEYVTKSTTGNGVLLSNFALNQDQYFDRKTLQGELPLDWDVQLFHNGILKGYQTSRTDGRFTFADVPLDPGSNDFLLVFHGPLGQRREETLSVLSEPGLGSGQFLRYRLSYDHPDSKGPSRSQATFDWGVDRSFVPFLSLAELPINGASKIYTQTGARGQVSGVGYQADWSHDTQGGDLYEASLKGKWDRMAWNLRHLEGRSFSSEVLQTDRGFLQSRTQGSLSGGLQTWGEGLSNVRLDLKQDSFTSGLTERQISLKEGHSYQGLYLTNGLILQEYAGLRSLGGELIGRKMLPGWMVQGQAGYTLSPKATLDTLAVSLDSLWTGNHQMQLALSQSLANHQLRVNAGLRSTLRGLDLGASIGWVRQGGWTVGLQVRTSFGQDPSTKKWHEDSRPVAASGSAAVLVFIDTNGNGIMDGEEKPVEGVSVLVDGVPQDTKTDATGHALIMHLPVNRPVDLGLNINDLEDPSLQPVRKGFRFVPRPGLPIQGVFPVVAFGEAAGTLRLQGPGGPRPMAGVTLELVDAQGRVIQRQVSSFDGYFDFADVPPGSYQLVVPATWLAKRQLRLVKPIPVQIDPTGSQRLGLSVELVPVPAA